MRSSQPAWWAVLAGMAGAFTPAAMASPPQWRSGPGGGFAWHAQFENGPTCLLARREGVGEVLYIGGHFDSAGGVGSANLVAFDGSGFLPVHGAPDGEVYGLTTFEIGGVPRVIAAGLFAAPGSEFGLGYLDEARVLRSMPHAPPIAGGWVGSAFAWSAPAGPEMVLSAGIFPPWSEYAYRYTPSGYAPLPPGIISIATSAAVFDDGGGPAIFLNMPMHGGPFHNALSRWDGAMLTSINNGAAAFGPVLLVFDDGQGPALYSAGLGVRRLRAGGSWEALAGAPTHGIQAIAAFDDGSGPALYVAGQFTSAGVGGTIAAANIARWRGGMWEAVGGGLSGGPVEALAVFDADGDGPRPAVLVAAGRFTHAGGVASPGLAMWAAPYCAADHNGDRVVTVQDIFDFLAAYFAGARGADVSGDGSTTVQDVFDFLAVYFSGCP